MLEASGRSRVWELFCTNRPASWLGCLVDISSSKIEYESKAMAMCMNSLNLCWLISSYLLILIPTSNIFRLSWYISLCMEKNYAFSYIHAGILGQFLVCKSQITDVRYCSFWNSWNSVILNFVSYYQDGIERSNK